MEVIKVVNKSGFDLPSYATDGSAAMDVKAKESMTIRRGEVSVVETGLYLEIPAGFKVSVASRSGLSFKHGLTVVNSPGIIDSDYRGELKVIMTSLYKDSYEVEAGERIAQIYIEPAYKFGWEEVDKLEDTKRGSGGLGSTGK